MTSRKEREFKRILASRFNEDLAGIDSEGRIHRAGQSPEVLPHPPVRQPAACRAAAASEGNADQQ
jgi:hypothetical protein